MSNTVFLSSVSNEFGSWRVRFAKVLGKTKQYHARHQDDFIAKGALTLETLYDEIEKSDLVLHVIGAKTGAFPTAEDGHKFLSRSALADFDRNYPKVAALARDGKLSYTQWEAWLALYLSKTLVSYQVTKRLPTKVPSPLPLDWDAQKDLQQKHAKLLRENRRYPKEADDDLGLIDETFLTVWSLTGMSQGSKDFMSVIYPSYLPYTSIHNSFVGRGQLSTQLEKELLDYGSPKPGFVVLHNTGGMGKTRMAVEFAIQHRRSYFGNYFINCESLETYQASLIKIAQAIKLPEVGLDDKPKVVQAALDWFRDNQGWLLILDNVDTELMLNEVEQAIPSFTNGSVLITSRNQVWSESYSAIRVEELESQVGIEFLLEQTKDRRLTETTDPKDAEAIVKAFGGLPLALECCRAYVNYLGISLREYYSRWTTRPSDIAAWQIERLTKYGRPMARTWEMTVEQLSQQARELFFCMVWLSNDFFPVEILRRIDSLDNMSIEQSLAELEAWSLIVRDDSKSQVRVTSNVSQEMTRLGLESNQSVSQSRGFYRSKILHALSQLIQVDLRLPSNWKTLESLVPQCKAVLLNSDASLLQFPDELQTQVVDDVLFGLCSYAYFALTQYVEVDRLGRLLLDYREQNGTNLDRDFDLNCILAEANVNLHQYPEARRFLDVCHEFIGAAELADQVRAHAIEGHLALVEERFDDAKHWLETALDLAAKSNEDLSALAGRLLCDLGQVHQRIGKIDLAIQNTIEGTSKFEQAGYLVHKAPNAMNLAMLYLYNEQPDQALKLALEAIEVGSSYYGESSLPMAGFRRNLAKVYRVLKKFDLAEQQLRMVIAVVDRPEVPKSEIAVTYNELGLVLSQSGKFQEAEGLLRKSLALRENDHGIENAVTRVNLASVRQSQGDLVEAETLARTAVSVFVSSWKRSGLVHRFAAEAVGAFVTIKRSMKASWSEILHEVTQLGVDKAVFPELSQIERVLVRQKSTGNPKPTAYPMSDVEGRLVRKLAARQQARKRKPE